MQPALIVVDVQNDFIPPDGALAVLNGQEVIPVINKVAPLFETVVTTQDWHPPNHFSFKEFGGIWPVHCVQNTFGAELHKDLKVEPQLFDKVGSKVDNEGYSAFDDSSLENWLEEQGIDTLFFAGLATDYCVKASVVDGLKHGFAAYVISDGCRAVEVSPGDEATAYKDMESAGATVITSEEVESILET
jgi:nicotinamidase/pyrazinamidase